MLCLPFQRTYVYFPQGLAVDDKRFALVDMGSKGLMGNTTVRGEWKISKSATRPTHSIVPIVSCSILQVPPISYLYIYAQLLRALFCNFLCDFAIFCDDPVY
jgi:hypothetical protein